MKKRDIAKGILGFSAGVGSGLIVGGIVKATTPAGAGKLVRGFRAVASFAISGIVGEAAENFMTKEIDMVAAVYDGIVGKTKAALQELKDEAEAEAHNITKLKEK